jgi:hypothetical protein
MIMAIKRANELFFFSLLENVFLLKGDTQNLNRKPLKGTRVRRQGCVFFYTPKKSRKR